MTKKEIIHKTVETLSKLPSDKVKQVDDFASFILKEYEEDILRKGVQRLAETSGSFDFLEEEEVLYTVKDLKERYK